MIIEEVYDALIEAGASQEKARAAARAIAGYDNLFSQMNNRLTQIEGSLLLVKWMLGFNLAFTVAMFFRLFS